MSNNVSKKLEIRAELLRNLNTAMHQVHDHKPSSAMVLFAIYAEALRFEHNGLEPDLQLHKEWLAG